MTLGNGKIFRPTKNLANSNPTPIKLQPSSKQTCTTKPAMDEAHPAAAAAGAAAEAPRKILVLKDCTALTITHTALFEHLRKTKCFLLPGTSETFLGRRDRLLFGVRPSAHNPLCDYYGPEGKHSIIFRLGRTDVILGGTIYIPVVKGSVDEFERIMTNEAMVRAWEEQVGSSGSEQRKRAMEDKADGDDNDGCKKHKQDGGQLLKGGAMYTETKISEVSAGLLLECFVAKKYPVMVLKGGSLLFFA